MEKINIIKELITTKEIKDNMFINDSYLLLPCICQIIFDKIFQEYLVQLIIDANSKKIENIEDYHYTQLIKTDITKKLYPMKKNIFIEITLVKEEDLGSPKKYQEIIENYNYDTQYVEEPYTLTDSCFISNFSFLHKNNFRNYDIRPLIKISIANYDFDSTNYDDYTKVIKSVFNID